MLPKKYDEWVSIIENRKVNDKYYKLTFRSKNLSQNVLPGQFIHIQIQSPGDLFLRRPFSYYRIQGDRIEILYEILGRGTAALAEMKKGGRLKVMGPLGKTFSLRPKDKKRVLVAGGVGIPPLLFLAERYPTDYLLIGTRSKGEVMPPKELAKVKGQVLYSTDDGSYGEKGFVTVLLEAILKKEEKGKLFIQTCGPKMMMRAVMAIARREGIQGEASLDETMGCAVGACLGCMVKTRHGWMASCVEGPIFPFEELLPDSC